MQRVRTISTNGRMSPVPRPASPAARHSKLTPLQTLYLSGNSLSRPGSPRSPECSQRANALPSPVSRGHISPQSRPAGLFGSHTALLAPRPSHPKEIPQVTRDITDKVQVDRDFSTFGGYGFVWKGSLQNGVEEIKIAVKRVRSRGSHDDKERVHAKLLREIRTWTKVTSADHPNIVPLLGIVSEQIGCYLSPAMVSPWMENGNLTSYLEARPNLPVSERFRILTGTANGLVYLHSEGVMHGDLNGANILIDQDGQARLIDFGLSIDNESTSKKSPPTGGALLWCAPEFILDDSPTPSFSCDVYSYASIVVQVFSGKVPYYGWRWQKVLYAVVRGESPPRPSAAAVTDTLWKFIQRCWNLNPTARPDIQEVKHFMDHFSWMACRDNVPAITSPLPLNRLPGGMYA